MYIYDQLRVSIHDSNQALGEQVAKAFADATNHYLAKKDWISVVLATGNSQLSFVDALSRRDDIEWDRIVVLHMDEYVGMSQDHPASFRRWMRERVVSTLGPKSFEGMNADQEDPHDEVMRYTALIHAMRPSITVMGIGENGHLAFNDPPADFQTPALARIVDLDQASRQQQVNEGHFPSVSDTPSRAISLTIPALLRSDTVLVGVPETRKAAAVRAALEDEVTPACPASILRGQRHAELFLDRDSASELSLT